MSVRREDKKMQCAGELVRREVWYTRPVLCSNPAKYQEDGKWYCGTHLPSKVETRQIKRDQQTKERWRREGQRETVEMLRRAARLVGQVDADLGAAVMAKVPEILGREPS